MKKPPSKVQETLRKFFYEGGVVGVMETKGDFAQALHDGVKLEVGSTYDNSAACSADCEIIKTGSTPVKSQFPDVVIGEVSAGEQIESRKRRKNYDQNRHFQDSWAAKLPWAEAVVGESGLITQVRCKICSDVEGREKLLVPKLDSLYKHAGRRKALVDIGKVRRGEYYYLGSNQHVKNERVFFAKGGETVITKVLAGVTKERRLKAVQFKCCLQVLQQGRPMADFTSMQELLKQLQVCILNPTLFMCSMSFIFMCSLALCISVVGCYKIHTEKKKAHKLVWCFITVCNKYLEDSCVTNFFCVIYFYVFKVM